MRKGLLSSGLLILLAAMVFPAYAQDTPDDPQCIPQDDTSQEDAPDPQDPECDEGRVIPYDPQTALMTVVSARLEMDRTSASPLGDDYDPATGTVTYSTTDISLPGNFAIPVELRRWVARDDHRTGGPGGGWSWNIPFIRGNYLDVQDGHFDTGWDWGYQTWHDGYNCSGSADSVINNNGDLIAANAYWQGKLLHIPGVTSETFLTTTAGDQVTKSNFKIASCINNTGGQEGIVVAGPNGLTYTFNQINSYYNGKPAYKDPIVRTRVLLVTKIEDRFGNHVDYTYTNGELTQISASDGRTITISDGAGATSTAVAHGRTWTYSAPAGAAYDLRVTLPDGVSTWEYDNVSVTAFSAFDTGGYGQRVDPPSYIPGCGPVTTQHTATVKTPGGLLATYTFQKRAHYRSNVEPDIYQDNYDVDYSVSRAINCTINLSLIAKTIAGPGVPTANFSYQYSANNGTYWTAAGSVDTLLSYL